MLTLTIGNYPDLIPDSENKTTLPATIRSHADKAQAYKYFLGRYGNYLRRYEGLGWEGVEDKIAVYLENSVALDIVKTMDLMVCTVMPQLYMRKSSKQPLQCNLADGK